MRLATTGNLLIGGTTDITGSGGLKVFGTTAASSTTSGALQVAGGVGVAGKVFAGGDIIAGSGQSSGYFLGGTGHTYIQSSGGSTYLDVLPTRAEIGAGVLNVITTTGTSTIASTTSSSTTLTGAFRVGDGSTAATNVAIGGGNVNAGGTGTFGGAVTVTNTGSGGLVVNNTIGNPLATFNASNADAGATNNAYIILQTASTARWYLGQSISAADGAFEIYGAAQAAASLKIAKTTGNISIASTTASTNTTSGALVVTGGVGVGGALNVGGAVTAINTTPSTAQVFKIGTTGVGSNASPLTSTLKFTGYAGGDKAQIQASDRSSDIGGSDLVFSVTDNNAILFTALTLARNTGAATFAGTVIAPAATTALAPMRIPHGTAPTSPVNGDMWTTTAGLFVRINGVTVGPLS